MEEIKSLLSGVDSTKIFFTDLNGRTRCSAVNPDNIERISERGMGEIQNNSDFAGTHIISFELKT